MTGMMDGLLAKLTSPLDSSSNTSASWLWGYAVALQFLLAMQVMGIYQYLLGANINPTLAFTASLIAYLSLAVWAFFIFKSQGILTAGDLTKLIQFLIISALYVFIPAYTYLLPKNQFLGGPSLSEWFSFLFYVVFPLWPLYIANHSGDENIKKWTHRFVNFWIVFILFVFIFFLASNINTAKLAEAGGRPEILGGADAFQFLIQKTKDTAHNFWKSIDLAGGVKVLINSSGLNYYTGTVDQNEKAPVGLYINNVRPSDKYFFVNSPVTIWADIKGKSFNEEIVAEPFCYINKGTLFTATPNPNNFSFFGESQDTLSCSFDSLPKGTHSVIVGAKFNFETWAYVTYTFVDQELDRAMQSQGKDINAELKIPRLPEAVYTNGPVFLGMGAQIDMPIDVDVAKNNRDPVIGVTIDNKWTDGEPAVINSFELGIPDDFQLHGCDRWYPDDIRQPEQPKDKPADGYNYYLFSKEDLEDQRAPFTSVTCRIHIKDPAKFLAGTQKVQRTFLSKVNYIYKLQKTTSVIVKE